MRNAHVRRILLAVIGSVMFATPVAGDAPPTDGTLNVGYTISFWTIPFGHTNYDGTFAVNSYSAKVHLETSGVVSMFWNSAINATVNGDIGAQSISPITYESKSQDRDKPIQRVKVTFEKGDPTTFADPPYNTTQYPVSEDQKKDTVDPMSAVTSILVGVKADAKDPCGTGAQVFDGRRRYDIVLTYLKDERVKLSSGLFDGNAHLCQIHFNHIAGYKQEIIGEDQEFPKMFADFADIPAADAPSGSYVVAVRLWSTQSLGTIAVTLDTIKVDGIAPAGMSAKS